MILVTVGTQLPFDRLIQAMDMMAPALPHPVFAQTGKGRYVPLNMEWAASVNASAFDAMAANAAVIVSHAGTGTILLAQKLHKPVVVLARRAVLGEHRNDHQVATAEQMTGRPGVYVAREESELGLVIERALSTQFEVAVPVQRERLKAEIGSFLAGEAN